MNDKPQQHESIPYTLEIRDVQDSATWRAYPSQSTTIQDMYRACKEFDLIAWVDLDNEVCLIPRDMTTRVDELPDATDLVRCMYGLGDPVDDSVKSFPVGPHDRSGLG